ncbi:MAG TPA: 7-cyano-7-deazaguanine synthase QueC [Thermomicrobiaceae bacterium]|nr:7-cyano-7-deazaguanine synthase QueC [Thermomicrobiaceae bacterium]
MTSPGPERKRAVVLLSGGLDSTTAAWLAQASNFDLCALSVDYGQRHRRELEAAARVAERLGARQQLVRLNLGDWGGSSLLGEGDIPSQPAAGIPSTWVPARNLIFLSIAAGYAEVVGASAIYIGVSQVDYSGYPDCRAPFLDAFQRAADLASKQFVEQGISIPVVAPFLHLSKAGIVRLGLTLGVDYALTWSCYQGGERPCGACDSCRLRAAAFAELGLPDPLLG